MESLQDLLTNSQQTATLQLLLYGIAIVINLTFVKQTLRIPEKIGTVVSYTCLLLAVTVCVLFCIVNKNYDQFVNSAIGTATYFISRLIDVCFYKYDEAIDKFVAKRNWKDLI